MKAGTENGDLSITLDSEGDVLGGAGEVPATPFEAAVVVAKAAVQVKLALDLVAVAIAKSGTKNVAVVNADVGAAGIERHCG
ncbi:hypothetical protein BGC29_19715 [Acinetobacter baumannii]|nr:hypothetical protein BGC29_19715 [Acinetobacter baumannii]